MTTKLVYVLTCADDKHYIEQALMAVYSARHWTPDAYIVLLVDNRTDSLLEGKRSEILKYVSEKIIVPFEDDALSPAYRSRFIKTSLRQRISGDFLFIDCDTITTRKLDCIDDLTCQVGAVPDSHLRVNEFGLSLLSATKANVQSMDIDLEKEDYYFSSGVMYVKDTGDTHRLYARWHALWLAGIKKGVIIDQPSLAKANIEIGHLINRMDDRFNCVMYTQPVFAKDAFILHFTAYRNPSWLFSEQVYRILQNEGIPEWLRAYILNPLSTYIPFRYTLYKSNLKNIMAFAHQIGKNARIYGKQVDSSFSGMQSANKWHKLARKFFRGKCYLFGGILCIFPAWISMRMHPANPPLANICSK